MAEHLTPTGRAAIIVPEGIIFQSQTAYTELRKMLVENSLVAVVSLPAGVFQPYSGVKTSILILDKSLARQAQTIAFFKVENDGFGLGAQRRAIEKNDLPQVQKELDAYLQALRNGQPVDELQLSCGLIVVKEKLAANGDHNLSGERYRENGERRSNFPLRRFDEVCTLEYGSSLPKDARIEGPYPVVGSNGVTGYHNAFLVEGPVIVVGRKGSAGEVTFIEKSCFPIDTTYYVKQTNPEGSDLRYLYWILKGLNLPELRGGAGIPGLNRTDVYETHKIPLPPLEVQKEIVAEIDCYQKVINGARAVLDNYRPLIPIHPEWPLVELGEICSLGGKITTDVNLSLPYFGADSIESNTGKLLKTETAESHRVNGPVYEFSGKRLLYSKIRPYLNKLTVVDLRGYCSSDMYPLLPDNTKVQITYLATYMLSDTFNERIRGYYERASIPKINRSQLFETKIPLPPLATQQQIVAEIEAEQALVRANRELIVRFEKKIQATLARVWGEEETTAAKT
jgi:type I restriction enzyme M protein